MKKYIKCYDKFNQQLFEGDYVDVQKDGVHQIYKKEDGQLYFKPYGKEDMVCAYFSNDIAKCDEVGNWLNNDRYEDIEEDVVKPETLEEAAKVIYPDNGYKDELYCDIGQLYRDLFIEGARWQQERMYSEKDLEIAFNLGYSYGFASDAIANHLISKEKSRLFIEWFEQFKKN